MVIRKHYFPGKKVWFVVVLATIGVFLVYGQTNSDKTISTKDLDLLSVMESEQAVDATGQRIQRALAYEAFEDNRSLTQKMFEENLALENYDENNLTQRLSRQALLKFNDAAQEGAYTEGNRLQIIDELASELSKPHYDIYTVEDISVRDRSNTISIQAYVTELLLILTQHAEVYDEDPLAIMDQWFSTNNSQLIQKVSDLSGVYAILTEELLSMTVPETIVTTHIQLVNSMQSIALSLHDMTYTGEDPARGMLAATKYADARSKRARSMYEITQYFDNHSLSLNK